MFDLFQREWDLITTSNILERKEMEAQCDYVITMVDEKGKWKVTFEPLIESGEWRITCNCMKFEQWGILCCHSLRILFDRDVKNLPDKYILKWWTRRARCGLVHDISGKQIDANPRLESSNRYRQLCPLLIRLASEAFNSPKAFSIVH